MELSGLSLLPPKRAPASVPVYRVIAVRRLLIAVPGRTIVLPKIWVMEPVRTGVVAMQLWSKEEISPHAPGVPLQVI